MSRLLLVPCLAACSTYTPYDDPRITVLRASRLPFGLDVDASTVYWSEGMRGDVDVFAIDRAGGAPRLVFHNPADQNNVVVAADGLWTFSYPDLVEIGDPPRSVPVTGLVDFVVTTLQDDGDALLGWSENRAGVARIDKVTGAARMLSEMAVFAAPGPDDILLVEPREDLSADLVRADRAADYATTVVARIPAAPYGSYAADGDRIYFGGAEVISVTRAGADRRTELARPVTRIALDEGVLYVLEGGCNVPVRVGRVDSGVATTLAEYDACSYPPSQLIADGDLFIAEIGQLDEYFFTGAILKIAAAP